MYYFVFNDKTVVSNVISRHSLEDGVAGRVSASVVPEVKSAPTGSPPMVALILAVSVPGEPILRKYNFTLVIPCPIEGVKVCALHRLPYTAESLVAPD